MIYFILATTILILFKLLLSIKSYKCCCWTKIKPHLSISILTSTLYMLLLEGYLEILVSSLISFKGAVTINLDDKISYGISLVLPIVLFTIIPAILLYVLSKSKD